MAYPTNVRERMPEYESNASLLFSRYSQGCTFVRGRIDFRPWTLFHGGNAGSNPAGDANISNHCRKPRFLTGAQRRHTASTRLRVFVPQDRKSQLIYMPGAVAWPADGSPRRLPGPRRLRSSMTLRRCIAVSQSKTEGSHQSGEILTSRICIFTAKSKIIPIVIRDGPLLGVTCRKDLS